MKKTSIIELTGNEVCAISGGGFVRETTNVLVSIVGPFVGFAVGLTIFKCISKPSVE